LIIDLIGAFGICTCLTIEKLMEAMPFFNERLSLVVFNYVLLLIDSKTGVTEKPIVDASPQQQQRRSIFFPLLVDQSLVAPLETNYNKSLFKTNLFHLLTKLDQQSVLVCRYLNSSLRFGSRFMKETTSTGAGALAAAHEHCSLKYKWTLFEIAYLYREVLKQLTSRADETSSPPQQQLLVRLMSKYLSDLLSFLSTYPLFVVSAQERTNTAAAVDLATGGGDSSSENEFEAKLNARFFEFLLKYSNKICHYLIQLKASHLVYLVVASQLILFKNYQAESIDRLMPTAGAWPSVELHLCKTVIETIDKNSEHLLEDRLVIDILLELFIKCALFRSLLNECAHFHVYLSKRLQLFFLDERDKRGDENAEKEEKEKKKEEDTRRLHEVECCPSYSQQELSYLEALLDLTLAYFYFNRKVIVFCFFFVGLESILIISINCVPTERPK
jgi:hypothetical protein